MTQAPARGIAARWAALGANTRGAVFVLLSGIGFTTVSMLVKLLGAELHAFQIAFFRAFFGLLVILPFALGQGLPALKTRQRGTHLLRAACGMGAMYCTFYAAIHLPLADVTAYGFTKAFFVVLFAALFLGERVYTRRVIPICCGFLGVLVLLRPGFAMEPAALVGLLAAVFMALVVVTIAKLGRSEPYWTVMFYFGVVSTLIAIGPAVAVWRDPGLAQLGVLALVAVCGVTAQTLMLRGFSLGETTAMVNFEYVQLLYAVLYGIFIFGDFPDVWTVAGSLIIVVSAS
ncbi:MAG: DMT family transporter [Kiloniellaceae bacterium]